MESFIVDDIDGDIARVETETGAFFEMPRRWLPSGLAEGQVISVAVEREPDGGATIVRYCRDTTQEDARRAVIRDKLDRLRARGAGS